MKKHLPCYMFTVLLSFLLVTACQTPEPTPLKPNIEDVEIGMEDIEGKVLPDMQLRSLDGKTIAMSTLKNKKVFVNLWATWCPPCVAELPSIEDLYSKTKANNVAFVMISLDDDFNTARKFIEEKGYNFPVYEVAGNMPEMFNTPGIPATFIFDETGKLKYKHIGMADYSKRRFVNMLQ